MYNCMYIYIYCHIYVAISLIIPHHISPSWFVYWRFCCIDPPFIPSMWVPKLNWSPGPAETNSFYEPAEDVNDQLWWTAVCPVCMLLSYIRILHFAALICLGFFQAYVGDCGYVDEIRMGSWANQLLDFIIVSVACVAFVSHAMWQWLGAGS